MGFTIHHAVAGLWPLVWHWGLQAGIIILCLAGEVALGMFASSLPIAENLIKPLQKDLLLVAAAAALSLYSFSDGVKVEHARGKAQQAVIMEQVGTVVDDVLNAPENQPQPEQPVKKGQKRHPRVPPRDRWDNPEN